MTRSVLARIEITAAAFLLILRSNAVSAAEAVRSAELVEAAAFLESYRAASNAHSMQFYDLYSDRAIVHARIDGQAEGVAFQGRAFKAWGRQLLEAGRAEPDGSIFRDATVEQRGSRLLIRAKRYSTTRCYWDTAYQMGIEREGSTYRIVDERLTTNPSAHCAPEHAAITGQRPLAPLPSPTSLPTIEGDRSVQHPTTDWHPVSEQELAAQAMQLAQQMAAARAAMPNSHSAEFLGSSTVSPPPRVSSNPTAGSAPRDRTAAPSDLWVSPQEWR